MSFFSKSRSKGHYPHSHHGSGYYKKPKGIIKKIIHALLGSKSHSKSGGHHGHGSYHRSYRHHKHKSSWS